MAITRSLTRQELDALGLPGDLPGERILLNEIWKQDNWCIIRRMVFRAPDDEQTWEIYYSTPLSKMQEGIDPWNGKPTVEVTMVELRTVFRAEWRRTGSPKEDDEVNLGIDEAITRGLQCGVCLTHVNYANALGGGRWAHITHPDDDHAAYSLIWGSTPPPWTETEL